LFRQGADGAGLVLTLDPLIDLNEIKPVLGFFSRYDRFHSAGKPCKTVLFSSCGNGGSFETCLKKCGRKRPRPVAAKGLFIRAFSAMLYNPYVALKPCQNANVRLIFSGISFYGKNR